MRYFIISIAFLLSTSYAGAVVRPDDFAYGRPILLVENGAVYRFEVPLEVYKTASTENISDIRVFNGAKAVVPHILRRPETKNGVSEKTDTLPFFPLYRKENAAEAYGLSVRINKGQDGAVINLEPDDSGIDHGKLSGYLIDISKHTLPIDALDLIWPEDTEDFVADVALEYSNDLTKWTALVFRSTIVLKRFGGQEVVRNRILMPRKLYGTALRGKIGGTDEFGSHPFNEMPDLKQGAGYLRLRWLSDSDGAELRELLAVQRTGQPQRERTWTEVDRMQKANDSSDKTAAFEYDSASRLPVDQIRVEFAEKNTLAKVRIYSRPDPESKWRHRQSSVLYHLESDKTSLIQDTVYTGEASDRYWRLEMDGNESGDIRKGPVIKLGWLPHELLFIARGEGPFMMAYGSARLGKSELEEKSSGLISEVIGKNESALIKQAYLSEKIVLGGPDLLVPLPLPLPWRDWLLWCVLVLGVGIIAKMAVSLFKGMDKNR